MAHGLVGRAYAVLLVLRSLNSKFLTLAKGNLGLKHGLWHRLCRSCGTFCSLPAREQPASEEIRV